MELKGEVNKLLSKRKLTIAIAESCSGGLLSSLLTELPGSSRYFKIGLITYSNEAKINMLKIKKNLIAKGAVSKEVARAMAVAIRKMGKTDLGLGITGIAGPGGARAKKPVGLIFIAIAERKKTRCWKFNFKGRRTRIRKSAALAALRLIKECIA